MNAIIMSIITRTQRSEQTAEGLLKTTVGSKQIDEGLGSVSNVIITNISADNCAAVDAFR